MPISPETQASKQQRKQDILGLPRVAEFLSYVQKLYSGNLVAVVATGSRTTGEHTHESDLDIDVLVANAVEEDIGKLKDLETRLSEFPRITPWVKSVREYLDPENFLTTKTPFDKFDLDGYSGLAKHVFWADIKRNGIPIAGDENIIGKLPSCNSIPKYEGRELYLIALKEFAKGNLPKALLRAAHGAFVALTGKSPHNYAQLISADCFTEKVQQILREAYDARLSKKELDPDKVWFVMQSVNHITLPIFQDALAKLDSKTRREVLAQERFYTLRTTPRFAERLAKSDLPMEILDIFAFDIMTAYNEADIRMHIDKKFELSKEAREQIKPLLERMLTYYNTMTRKILNDPSFVIALGRMHSGMTREADAITNAAAREAQKAASGEIFDSAKFTKVRDWMRSEASTIYSNELAERYSAYFDEFGAAIASGDGSAVRAAFEKLTKFQSWLAIRIIAIRKSHMLALLGKHERALQLTDFLLRDAQTSGLWQISGAALNFKAKLLYNMKRYAESEACLNELIVKFGAADNLQARLMRSNCFLRLDRKAEALEECLEAKKLADSAYEGIFKATVRNTLGNILYSMKREDEALKEYYEAVLLVPDESTHRLNLGRLLAIRGRHVDALEQFETAMIVGRKDFNAIKGAAEAAFRLSESGDHVLNQAFVEKATKYLLEAAQINMTTEICSELMMLFGRLRNKAAADMIYDLAKKAHPDDVSLLFVRGISLGYLREDEQAVETLNQYLLLEKDLRRRGVAISEIPKLSNGVVKYNQNEDRFYFDTGRLVEIARAQGIQINPSETSFSKH